METKINPEYEKLLPKLSNEEYQALKESIKTEGQHYAIVVNEDFEILDGHHRLKACQELGVEPDVEVRKFDNKLKEKKFVLESNLLRRHLDTWHRIKAGKPLLEVYQQEAEERQKLSGELYGRGKDTQNIGEPIAEGEALEKFADAIHSNPETVRQALWIEENAPEKIAELDKGEAISKVYRNIAHKQKIEELRKQLPKLSEANGVYDVIVIDPPWPMQGEYDAERFRGAPPYPLLSIEELKNLKIPANDNCVLWLWATNSFLHEAYHLLEAWEFEPKSVLTWVKDSIGVGVWLRGQTEHCVLATKGNPVIDLHGQSTALIAPKTEHSEKPREFYDLVTSLCIGRKLDYYARKQHEGWDVFGTLEKC